MNYLEINRMLKGSHKVIGYFSYTRSGDVLCDDDACIIAGSTNAIEEQIIRTADYDCDHSMIKKTRFEEIMIGLAQGGAYAFDAESYARFLPLARKNGGDHLPGLDFFESKVSLAEPHYIRICEE